MSVFPKCCWWPFGRGRQLNTQESRDEREPNDAHREVILILFYGTHRFEFMPTLGTLRGSLVLSPAQKADLCALEDAAPEHWYLDSNGERLPPDRLFELSPWHIETPGGKIKILNRLLNPETGEAWFNVADTYGGESFLWLRKRP